MKKQYEAEYFQKSAEYILSKINHRPEIAVILGTCLGDFSDQIKNPVVIDYKDIPNFLISTVQGHAGKLIIGELEGKTIVAMSGRFHYYEGYDFEELVLPIRVLHLIGAKTVLLTNAVGAINTSYQVGDIMMISDHIQLWGVSPTRGANVPEFGDRFFDISHLYTPKLRVLAKECAEKTGLQLQEGVYFYSCGPHFETPAEIRAMRILGGDVVGMSTITEALTAGHIGMQVLGLSLVTNMAAGVLDVPISGVEMEIVANKAFEKFQKLLCEILSSL